MNCEHCESPAVYGVDFGYGGRMNLCEDCYRREIEIHNVVDVGAPVEKRPIDVPLVDEAGAGLLSIVACLPYVALGAGLVALVLAVVR